MREGTLVDATIIAAPPSTKNKDHARDPEMHQAKKGNQRHFGMKAHIGVDAESGLVHSGHATAANESDVAHTHELLHGQAERVHADAGYTGVDKREEIAEAQKEGDIREDVKWLVATKRGVIKAMEMGVIDRVLRVWGPSAAAPSLHALAWTARGVAASRGNAACQASPIARGAAAGPHSM
jgi:IS5 family transposase